MHKSDMDRGLESSIGGGSLVPNSDSASAESIGTFTALVHLGQLLKEERWDSVVEGATELIDLQHLNAADTGKAHLYRGRAWFESGNLEKARDDLKLAWRELWHKEEAAALLIQVLSELEEWKEVVRLAKQIGPELTDLPKIVLQKANALRHLGRQDEALEELEAFPLETASMEHIRLRALLLCDIGDFEEALDILMPATTPLESAAKTLLALRGWAHQNCEGEQHAWHAERVYRRALMSDEEDYWSRKGLANALRRRGELEEANREYEIVIDYARQQRAQCELNPYDACLAGWCCYCVNRFKEAADFSSAGLAAIGVGAAAQFDYGLILLADSSCDSAKDQFERSIQDVAEKNYLRRCGLLYVALTDLRDAVKRLEAVANAPETYSIQTSLAEALEKTLQEFPRGRRDKLKQRVQAYIDVTRQEASSLEMELAAMLSGSPESIDWRELQIVGFTSEEQSRPCAMLWPVVSHKRLVGRRYSLSASGLAGVSVDEARMEKPDGPKIRLFATAYPAAVNSRVLWISHEMLSALGLETMTGAASPPQWEAIGKPVEGEASAMAKDRAEDLLNEWTQELNTKAVDLLILHFQQNGETPCDRAASIAGYAVAAATVESRLHAAILAFGAAGGVVQSPRIADVQPRLVEDRFKDAAGIEREVQEFKELILLRAKTIGMRAGDDPELVKPLTAEEEEQLPPTERLRKRILDRARTIAEIAEPEEQNRLAAEASAEMQSLVPLTDRMEKLRMQLAEKMNEQEKVYLDDQESILLMSREPAFYASSVLLKTERPLIHSFTFRMATRRLIEAGIRIPAETLYLTK